MKFEFTRTSMLPTAAQVDAMPNLSFTTAAGSRALAQRFERDFKLEPGIGTPESTEAWVDQLAARLTNRD